MAMAMEVGVMEKALNLLGLKVKDRVTGFAGTVTSVSFDLYGCIQALVHPGLDKDEKLRDMSWFDVNRLEVTSPDPVMSVPAFAAADKGPEAKPIPGQA